MEAVRRHISAVAMAHRDKGLVLCCSVHTYILYNIVNERANFNSSFGSPKGLKFRCRTCVCQFAVCVLLLLFVLGPWDGVRTDAKPPPPEVDFLFARTGTSKPIYIHFATICIL